MIYARYITGRWAELFHDSVSPSCPFAVALQQSTQLAGVGFRTDGGLSDGGLGDGGLGDGSLGDGSVGDWDAFDTSI